MNNNDVKTEDYKKEDTDNDNIPLSHSNNLKNKRKVPSESMKEEEKYSPIKKKSKKYNYSETSEDDDNKGEASSASADDDDNDDEDFIKTNRKKSITIKKKRASNGVSAAAVSIKKKVKKEETTTAKKLTATPPQSSPRKKKDTKKEEEPVWEWWKEDKPQDGTKWNFLEHRGPLFAPPYEPLPKHVKFYYDGKALHLCPAAEEVATFYSKLIEHEYTTKEVFNTNFFTDWRANYMSSEEKHVLRKLDKCNFTEINEHFKKLSEERKARSKEEKAVEKKKNEEIVKEYGMCMLDTYKQKIGNFRIEPPGLFRGRGDHPKMGQVKRRLLPEDVIINCSKKSIIPQAPAGHKWKEVRHDNAVSWLACWCENVQGNYKYVMLNASSKLKGERDWSKYEKARKLHHKIFSIRENYTRDFKDKEMRIRQRAVALYFIDKLALRAGNEKDEDEADTVGCCSLRVEHTKLHEEQHGQKYVVEFDFLGKDSIRYQNSVSVLKRVFRNLQLFIKNKNGQDDLFDRLNTSVLNKYLSDIMPGLTAKVFRTYNASLTLEQQLMELTDPKMDVVNKILAYNRANRAVAVLCNHQRSIPKTHEKSMDNLKQKVDEKKKQITEAKTELKHLKADYSKSKEAATKKAFEAKKKKFEMLKLQLSKLEVLVTDKDENKSIALSTSKLNYLDPRISVAWCKKFDVPIEKVYNKTQREKFQWAIDMATKDFVFKEEENKNLSSSSLKNVQDEEEEEDDEEEEASE